MSSVVVRDTSQSDGVAETRGCVFSPSGVDESDSRVAYKVWDYESVFAATSFRSGMLWRDPPTFAVLRFAACTN